jgi:hypothetical protein
LLLLAGGGLLLVARSLLGSESVRTRLQAQLTDLTGQPVTIGSASASVFPRVAIELADVAIGQPVALRASRLSVATGLRGLFARRIEDAEVVLSDASLTLPLPFPLVPPPGPSASPQPAPGGGPPASVRQESAGFTIASVRVIAVRNLDVTIGSKSLQVDLESALDGDRLEVSTFTARSEHTNLEAKGTIESLERLEGTFTVAGTPLDLDELLALTAGLAGSTGSTRRSTGSSAGPSRMRIGVKLSAAAGRLAGYDFSDLVAGVEVIPARVTLSPLSFRMFGGGFDGTMTVDPSAETPEFKVNGTIAGVDVAALAAAGGSRGAMTGRLRAKIAMTGRGIDGTAMLTSVRGSADGVVTDGEIPGLDMVRTVVLAFGKPSGAPPAGSGSAFSRLGGTFQLDRGTLTSNNVALASRDFDLSGSLTMKVPSGALHARADVILSEELTKQAGTDLRRYAQEDGRVVLPANITGTLAQPVVTIDLAAAAGRALQNELKRRAKSLLDKLFKKGAASRDRDQPTRAGSSFGTSRCTIASAVRYANAAIKNTGT